MEKEEIYRKSLKLFLDRGYDNTPMSLVAKEVGISKGGLFHHFPTKEYLLYEIVVDLLETDFVPIIEQAEKIVDPKEKIVYFVENYTKLLTSNEGAKVVLHEVRRLHPESQQTIKKIWRRTYDFLSGAIVELQQSGHGKEFNRSFITFALLGMCSWIFYWFDYSRPVSTKELADAFGEIFFNGFLKAD